MKKIKDKCMNGYGELVDIDNPVLCPICEDEHNHPVELIVNAGGKITKVTSKGTTTFQGEPLLRGVHIFIKYHCEQGHVWVQRIAFHKGSTYVENIDLGDEDTNSWLDEIWRD